MSSISPIIAKTMKPAALLAFISDIHALRGSIRQTRRQRLSAGDALQIAEGGCAPSGEHDPEKGCRFFDKIMLHQKVGAR
ncbi:hypothetical protein [Bradyrhizobium sp. WD16]|uniref:hypothetical protein n=1 Tax=Bradyrhizobium sp. WD16 TaxID=1521768 RepID=UPI0020A4431E|nr:hypothetical protein [Bradyrhizobium sp. WD16]UTD28154.1 hypothetical protein DB459_15875 [Bradyrhizobium sp. WD16]